MKAHISCFGHGWACELPGKIHYVGSFPEALEVFQEWSGQLQIAACMAIYRSRMGQIDTRGNA